MKLLSHRSPLSASTLRRQTPAGRYQLFVGLERLEERTLLSANFLSAQATQPLARLPNESLNTNPKFSDLWYFHNTGQTLTNASSGPSTGKAGADIHATDAWDLTTGSNTVVIAVLDTGVDLTNPDLAGNIWTNPAEIAGDGIDNDHNGFIDDVHGWNFIDGNNNVQDTVVHGTTTNGVIGAVGNNGIGIPGVAWNVKLLDVKVGDFSGVSDANLVAGINYIIKLKQEGVNIVAINASYFGTGATSLSDFAAIKTAGDNGLLYIAAAGNAGLNLDIIPSGFLPANMIFVAATDAQDNLASFSDYGGNTVALAAPGVDITTPVFSGLDLTLSGTSYSAPMVSGTIALMKSLVPGASMAQLKSALLSSTDMIPSLVGKTTYGRLNTYKALETLLGAQAPRGNVDVFNSTKVVGWAYDANAGLKQVTVQLVIDGVVRATTTANINRPDLTAAVGSPNHGFSFTLPALSGSHTIQILVKDFDPYRAPMASKVLKSVVLNGPSLPIGWIDAANVTTVAGWALDPDAPASAVTVRVDVDGSSIGTFTANISRRDLVAKYGSANHGFSVSLPALSASLHRIDVYAFDTATNTPRLIGSRTVGGNAPPTGYIDVFNGTTVLGWAADANQPTSAIQVQYSIDNGPPTQVTAGDSRPDLVAHLGSANHGFSITIPQLMVGTHRLTVSAVDPDTGSLVSLGSKSMTVTNPTGRILPRGNIDIATTGMVAGWAFDATAGAAPISVRVDVDGLIGTPFVANLNRSDLTAPIGSADHGFSQALSLTPGEHTIAVYAIGLPTDETVLIGQKVVGSGISRGVLDVINNSVIMGWAFNAGAGTGPVTVRLDIDGVAGAIATANVTRNDLTPVIGSPNHGFSISTPSLVPGTHKIALVVLDPVTLEAVTVSTGTLVV